MQKMYKTLDEFIAYMYDKRTGSEATSDSYYRDIAMMSIKASSLPMSMS